MPLESLSDSAELLDEFEKVDEPFRLGPRELYVYISAYAIARAQSINSYVWANVMHRLAAWQGDWEDRGGQGVNNIFAD